MHRKLLTSAFHFNILQQFVGVFKKETDKLILELDDLLRNVDEIDIVNLISQFTLYSINGELFIYDVIDNNIVIIRNFDGYNT